MIDSVNVQVRATSTVRPLYARGLWGDRREFRIIARPPGGGKGGGGEGEGGKRSEPPGLSRRIGGASVSAGPPPACPSPAGKPHAVFAAVRTASRACGPATPGRLGQAALPPRHFLPGRPPKMPSNGPNCHGTGHQRPWAEAPPPRFSPRSAVLSRATARSDASSVCRRPAAGHRRSKSLSMCTRHE